MVLEISFVLLLASSLSVCQDVSHSQADGGSADKNQTMLASMNTISQPNATAEAHIANINATASNNLKYIWTISGIEDDQVIMALDQEGNYLFGRAKYELDNGESWNGNVAGILSGNDVYLVITAPEGDKQVSICLDGIFADEAISGKFFKTSEGKMSGRGLFNAMWINPDLSSYAPVEIKENRAEMQAQAANATSSVNANQAPQQKTIYHDVLQDADRILTGVGDISQVPIGMGGSGLP